MESRKVSLEKSPLDASDSLPTMGLRRHEPKWNLTAWGWGSLSPQRVSPPLEASVSLPEP